jgi:hypothetical protein
MFVSLILFYGFGPLKKLKLKIVRNKVWVWLLPGKHCCGISTLRNVLEVLCKTVELIHSFYFKVKKMFRVYT